MKGKRVRQRPSVWKVSSSWCTVAKADCARWSVYLLLIWFAVQTSLHDMCHECGLVPHLRSLFYVSKNCVLCGQTSRSVLLFCLKTDDVVTTFGYQHRRPLSINQKLTCIRIADLVVLEYFMAVAFLYFHLIWLCLWAVQTYAKRLWIKKHTFGGLACIIMGYNCNSVRKTYHLLTLLVVWESYWVPRCADWAEVFFNNFDKFSLVRKLWPFPFNITEVWVICRLNYFKKL